MDLDLELQKIRSSLATDLLTHTTPREIEELKVKFLGKKGRLQAFMLALKELPPEQKPLVGKRINEVKQYLTEQLECALANATVTELEQRLSKEKMDVTLPGRRRQIGRKHVLTQFLDEAIDLLTDRGFSVQYGPDIETDYYNFEALNFTKDHPARDMHDTFYLTEHSLLRTHTSNTQVRVMELSAPPIRMIAPGKCYRNENISARSHMLFHQIEGLYIDHHVSFADLFSELADFFPKLLHREDLALRYRPSYFPFVEPGVEVDISCLACSGKGCSLCKQSGWLEVAGAGMVHPEVLKSGGIDPEVYQGYAWGFGIERLAMLQYGIADIRLFLENDMRFLQQF